MAEGLQRPRPAGTGFWGLSPHPPTPLPRSLCLGPQRTRKRVGVGGTSGPRLSTGAPTPRALGSGSPVCATATLVRLRQGRTPDQPRPRLCSRLRRGEEPWALAPTPRQRPTLKPSSVVMSSTFEGLPALEGNARASLLSAPGSVLQAVEDHRGLVQPRVEMQGGLAARLLAAQQVYVEPGRWGMRAGVPFCRGLTFCPGPPPFPGTSAVPRQVREGAVADWRPRSPVSRASAIQLGTWTHMALGEGHCALPGVPLIPRGWDLPRNHGPEDQGAPGGQDTPSSQRARTIAGMAGFPGTPDSQES